MAEGNGKGKPDEGYSRLVCSVYVFNLMIGAGVFSLPKAFAQAGIILGLISLAILGLTGYCTTTFLMETLAISNAFERHRLLKEKGDKAGERNEEGLELSVDGQGDSEKESGNPEKPDLINEIASEPAVFINSNSDDAVVSYSHSKNNSLEDASGAKVNDAAEVEEEGERKPKNLDSETLQPKETEGAHDKQSEEANGVIVDGKHANGAAAVDSESQLDHDTLYEITEKFEIGEMTGMLLPKVGMILYYVSITLQLLGSLSIYSAAISKSLTAVVCGNPNSFSGNGSQYQPCENVNKLSVMSMYRIVLAGFVVTVCPFVFFTISKTKFLQIFTIAYRLAAFTAMIILAAIRMGNRHFNTEASMFNFEKLPNYFGVAVYAFLCQESIPAVITPVRIKARIYLTVFIDFICVFAFYSLLILTAALAFHEDEIQDLYSLNFDHPLFFRYVLELFPVFTLSTNFPVLAIVLRDNLKGLFLKNQGRDNGLFLRRIFFPLLVLTPPICIAASTTEVGLLVGYTGTYAGAIIQYVIPSMLVYWGRKKMTNLLGVYNNKYQAPFFHTFWVILVCVWYLICLVFVTYNKIKSA